MRQIGDDYQIEINAPFWMGVVFFLAVVVSCVYLFLAAQKWLQDSQQLPISQLKVAGERHYVSHNELYKALQPELHKSFFMLDVNRAQAALQQINWVEYASVRKEWPETLNIFVVEQKPVAVWNQDYLLNENGEIFQADKNRLDRELPELTGPPDAAKRVWETYQQYASLLKLHGFEAQALMISPRFSMQLKLKGGLQLKLGRENGETRVKRFLRHYSELQHQENLEYVDLRYDTGFAVGKKVSQS
ncbi:cell division protein FtsQ/DivIB [Gayadomonas joobiniege]|uniref:cell division protein FtsQ/DivIB n=1 Tax=Gayadomonas joobiniege TaxID=1234606 RepID=UPI00036C328D|nr:cell division protein FtsQ/DivIB [Gayadomonas joobiniege]